MTYFNTTKKMYYDYKSNYLIIQIVTIFRILGYEKRLSNDWNTILWIRKYICSINV